MSHLLKLIFSILIILSTACKTPEPYCSQGVEIDSFDNGRVAYHIDEACRYFVSNSNHSNSSVRDSLEGVKVFVRKYREPTQCSEPNTSCARLLPLPTELDIRRDEWQAHLHHEVWHTLIFRLEPGLDIDDHHSRMLELGLCQPARLCGYGVNPG